MGLDQILLISLHDQTPVAIYTARFRFIGMLDQVFLSQYLDLHQNLLMNQLQLALSTDQTLAVL